MNIAKALKIKNRLARKVQERRDELIKLSSTNTIRYKTEATAKAAQMLRTKELNELYEELQNATDELVDIKAKIAKANAPIWETIFRMAEAKGELALIKVGIFPSNVEVNTHYNQTTGTLYSIGGMHVDYHRYLMDHLQNEIDELQDTLDEFNASTTI